MGHSKINKYKKGDLKEKAIELGINQDTLTARFRSKGIIHIPNYTEMEIFILSNFHWRICIDFIPHKSPNALKTKQHRLIKKGVEKYP